MKAFARIAITAGILACVEGMAQAPVNGTSDPAAKTTPAAATKDPAQVQKSAADQKTEEARRNSLEQIQRRQDIQDSLNSAIVDALREEAKREHQERNSRGTGGGYPQEPKAGKTPKN